MQLDYLFSALFGITYSNLGHVTMATPSIWRSVLTLFSDLGSVVPTDMRFGKLREVMSFALIRLFRRTTRGPPQVLLAPFYSLVSECQ